MDRLAQLEARTTQLSAAVQSLAGHRRNLDSSRGPGCAVLDPETCKELDKAKSSILASLADIKRLVAGPADFLQHLASQVQVLACLQWLADFQILACIPLDTSVPIRDLVDLAGVPEGQLARVIRLTAAVGFLKEPAPHVVAHTPLSAQFVADESLVDAAMFLAQVVAPSALQMPLATQQFGAIPGPGDSAFSLRAGGTAATTTPGSFEEALDRNQKLGRQWRAHLQHSAGLNLDDEIVDVISQLNWSGLNHACIVEPGGCGGAGEICFVPKPQYAPKAQRGKGATATPLFLQDESANKHWPGPQVGARSTSMARCLVERFPGLRVVVQLDRAYCPGADIGRVGQNHGLIGDLLLGAGSSPGPIAAASAAGGAGASSSSGSGSGSGSTSTSNSPRITVIHRDTNLPQPVTDADVYILHLREALSSPRPAASSSSAPPGLAEPKTARPQLHEYLAILRDSGRIALILTSHLLPEPDSLANPEVEAVARARDLTLLHLANESDMEMTDLQGAVEGVSDRAGRLVIASWLRSHNGLVLALAVKYQAH